MGKKSFNKWGIQRKPQKKQYKLVIIINKHHKKLLSENEIIATKTWRDQNNKTHVGIVSLTCKINLQI